jgi:phage baseplate assembly protein W
VKRSIALPFRIAGDVELVGGPALERAKVMNILLVEPGELPWRTSFGTPLDALRHRPMDAVHVELVRVRCEDALATWLPSVDVVVTPKAGGSTEMILAVAIGAASAATEVAR